MLNKLAADLWVPASIDEVWKFAQSPQNLAKISPPRYGVRVAPGAETKNGGHVQIIISPFGLPFQIKWDSVIEDVTSTGSQRKFVDVQTKGPFKIWRHQHLFESGQNEIEGQRSESKVKFREPGTWLRDRIEYEIPFGFLGQIAQTLVT